MESLKQPEASNSQEEMLEASTKKDVCAHPFFIRDLCALCGQTADDDSGVSLAYMHKGLRVRCGFLMAQLRDEVTKRRLRHKKACLVLDLDHTLLNSTALKDMTTKEEYLKSQTDTLQGGLFMLEAMQLMTKLRPFVHSFLEEASKLFEMYIYTMGSRSYASEIAKLLDPKKQYFGSRVISREESTIRHQKGLDLVLAKESAVLIIDDTESVWPKCQDNLIVIERYNFFASSCRQFGLKSLSELRTDENESDGALATLLKVLRQIHDTFFEELGDDIASRDVRQVLKTIRKEVLKGCKIFFSHIFSGTLQAEKRLWRIAEQLGATCSRDLDESVTHVVSTKAGIERSHCAVRENKFLVNPRWLEASNYFWKRQPEDQFEVEILDGENH